MRVMLINPPTTEGMFNQFGGQKGWLGEPLGIGYLAAYLRQNGSDVKILDACLFGLDITEILQEVIEYDPAIVGVTTKFYTIAPTMKICSSIKKYLPNCHITLGGYFATFNYQDILTDLQITDSIVIGEGEETLFELVQALNEGKDHWKKTPGIAYIEDEKVIVTAERELIEDLDKLPFPARDYLEVGRQEGSIVQMATTRGCYGSCSYCVIGEFYKMQKGRKWRYRSAENIVDEIEYLVNEHNTSFIEFVDDTFIGPGKVGKERVLKFANEIKNRGIKIEFAALTRPNEIDLESIKTLYEVGLRYLFVGIESGHQRGLNTFNKKTTVLQNIEAIKVLQQVGVYFQMGLIFFDPYTTLEECTENLDFIEKLGIHKNIGTIGSEMDIFPGTKLAVQLAEENNLTVGFPVYKYEFEDKRVEKLIQLFKEYKANPKQYVPVIWIQEFLTKNRKSKAPILYSEIYEHLEEAIIARISIDIQFFRRAIDFINNGCIGQIEVVSVKEAQDFVKQQLDLLNRKLGF